MRARPGAGPIAALLLCSIVATACVTFAPRSREAGPRAQVVPGVPLGRFGPDRCGAGALSGVLNALGDPVTVETLDTALPKTHGGGVLSVDLLLQARQRGFDARLVRGSAEAVREAVGKGRPSILMLRVLQAPGTAVDLFHYVIADGVDPEQDLVRLHFGDGAARWVRFARIERAWAATGHSLLLIGPRSDPARGEEELLAHAVALESGGRIDEAISEYRRVLAADPEWAVAWTDLGNAESRAGNRREAEEAYRHALSLDPAAADALNNLAWLLLEEGVRLAEAEDLARRAVALGVSPPDAALDTLGRVLLARGACREASDVFRRAVGGLSPEREAARPSLLAGLGIALRDCGDAAGARSAIEAARTAHPDEATSRALDDLEASLREPHSP